MILGIVATMKSSVTSFPLWKRGIEGNSSYASRRKSPLPPFFKGGLIGILSATLFSFLTALFSSMALAQDKQTTTPDIFRQFSEHVVKIEVVETGSAAKATIGTGFYADAAARIVTNYHVVSKLIHSPERYRIEITNTGGQTSQATVLGVDVVYDLAVLHAPRAHKGFLQLAPIQIQQGTRLYSLGHPRDLGLTIVEGTYNGLLQHTLYPKILFSGSINPGMSGGPTVTQAGSVVGINVSTQGEQISFLVPVERAIALLERTAKVDSRTAASFLPEVGRQIHAYQSSYLAKTFVGAMPTLALGPYELPTKPAPFFRCWADAVRRKDLPYAVVNHDCSTDDYIFVSAEQSSGIVRFNHQLLSTGELNPMRFFSLYGGQLQAGKIGMIGNEEEVTSFRCETRNVALSGGKVRSALCARQYIKLPGLFDAMLRVAPVGSRNAGLISTLSLSGVSYDNVEALARRYLEAIKWRR